MNPSWVVSQRLQLSKYCSDMALYHGAHRSGADCSSMKTHWLLPDPSDLLFHHGLCSTGCSSDPGAYSCRSSLWAAAFFKLHFPSGLWILCGATCRNLCVGKLLLDRKELLLSLWSTSCPPSALMMMAADLLLSHFSIVFPSCCCASVFPNQHCSWLSSGQQ